MRNLQWLLCFSSFAWYRSCSSHLPILLSWKQEWPWRPERRIAPSTVTTARRHFFDSFMIFSRYRCAASWRCHAAPSFRHATMPCFQIAQPLRVIWASPCSFLVESNLKYCQEKKHSVFRATDAKFTYRKTRFFLFNVSWCTAERRGLAISELLIAFGDLIHLLYGFHPIFHRLLVGPFGN